MTDLLKKERFKQQCHIQGCDSMAHWEPHVRLWYRGLDGRPLPLDMKASCWVCDKHRSKVAQLLSSIQNKSMIAEQLVAQNLGQPDFSSMQIKFEPIYREPTVIEIAAPKAVRCGRQENEAEQCANPAAWQVYFKVWGVGQRRTGSFQKLLINLHLCNKCKKITAPEDFMNDRKFKSDVTASLAKVGCSMPDWKTMEIGFIAMKNNQPIDPDRFVREM